MEGTLSNNIQRVIIDREATNDEALSPKSVAAYTPPPGIDPTNGQAMGQVPLGAKIVKYFTNTTSDGSLDGQGLIISKPHRLLRVEVELLTSAHGATSFTGTVSVLRLVSNFVGINGFTAAAAYNTLQATPTTTPGGNLSFIFGEGYENEACSYAVFWTAANTTLITFQFIIEYL